jgi:hypothetical protein
MSGIHCGGTTPKSCPKSNRSASECMAVPMLAALFAPATSIADSIKELTAILSSCAALIDNNMSGRVVKPIAAIRIFHATNADASSNELAIVVARV